MNVDIVIYKIYDFDLHAVDVFVSTFL